MDVVMGIYTVDAAESVALVTLHRELGSEDVAFAIHALALGRLPCHRLEALPLLVHQEA